MPDSDIELAWAAGFFDGEGSTMFTAQSSLKVMVNQTNRETLVRFQKAVGAGTISGPYQHRTNRQPHWSWYANGQGAMDVVGKLFELLCEPKQDQILLAVAKRQAFEELVSARINAGNLRRIA